MRDRPGRPRVMIGTGFLVMSPENRLLIVQQDNKGVIDWGFNGGGLEVGETIHECALRECKEELGLDTRILRLLAVDEIWREQVMEGIGFVFLLQPEPWPQEPRFGQEDMTTFLGYSWLTKNQFVELAGKPGYDFWDLPWPLDVREPLFRQRP